MVEHLHQVIKTGLLGRESIIVKGEEPTRRFFSGVLFPDNEFVQQVSNEEEEQDPQPVYRSMAKNCNIGLEYLVMPTNKQIRLSVSGSFKLYPRLFPDYNEQLQSLDYLEINAVKEAEEFPLDDEHCDSEQDNTTEENDNKVTTHDKGLNLLEKYRQLEVSFSDIYFSVDLHGLNTLHYSLQEVIDEKIQKMIRWDDLFCVKPEFIHNTGTVALPSRPENEGKFREWLNDIKGEINLPNWTAKIAIEPKIYRRHGEELVRVVTTLINETPTPDKQETPTGHPIEFFDCGIQVKIIEGEHIPFEFEGAPRDYKYDKSYAVKGINCVGLSKEKDDFKILETESIPVYFQKLYRTIERDDLSIKFEDLVTPQGVNKTLRIISSKMRDYLSDWKYYIDNFGDEEQPLKTEKEVEACKKDYKEFEEEINSFELGLYSLNQDSRLMNAFNMMNEVFVKSGKGKYTSWRLFQIIFIVRMIPSLHVRELKEQDPKKEEIIKSSEYADVLWFPTGGGKTEAYLGLIVTTLFFDRLRGKKIGCSAWIRFPLRMLSKQQLDRLARVIIIAEEYRQNNSELNGKGVPFSIGFFAGGSNTANFLSEKKKSEYFSSSINMEKAMLIHRCPYCNEKLSLDFDDKSWKLLHKCTNTGCFIFNSQTLKGNVPIYITDSEVYRFVPSILCGTVDKLAILGRYREFSHIFGQIGGLCEQHGYYSDRCIVGAYDNFDSCKSKATPSSKSKVAKHKEHFYDPVPSLLIQDELHLLKEELGALNGHYEGVINELSRCLGRKNYHLPKVIAATATIESYEHHINHLYVRPPRKYPSMGYKNGESFYATSSPEIKRRLYMGVLSHTRSQDEIIGRCLYLYHREILKLTNNTELYKEYSFESITSEKQFAAFLSDYDLSVVYVNQKSMGHDVKRRITESTSPNLRRLDNQDFDLETEMLTGENDMDKIVAVIDRIESEGKGTIYKNKLHTLIATSLISHGVDLERVNAFFMAGMTSKQAEYIQASSRSARTHAGLVLVSFRPNDLRERSQYQFFIQNHTFLDRLVDPVPINRLALKAIERTVPGILSGLLLGLHSHDHDNTIYNCGEYQKYIANQNSKGIRITEEIINQIKRVIGTDNNLFPITARERADELIENIFNEKHHILNTSSRTLKIKDEKALDPITSFRDIEEGLPINPEWETNLILKSSSLS